MAEFLTMQEAEDKFGKKGKTNAALTLGIIGTALGAFSGNAAENLLATIRKSKEYIQSQIKAKEEKVNTLLELMESDPEMKKRFDELMMNKTAK